MRNARGSNQRRMPAVQPEPGPPWRTTAGLAEGLPQPPSTLLAVADSEHPVLVGFDRGKSRRAGNFPSRSLRSGVQRYRGSGASTAHILSIILADGDAAIGSVVTLVVLSVVLNQRDLSELSAPSITQPCAAEP